ncbi:hypothetical protein B0H10DRAFT_1681983, partial [Mycena sp. CBHHK59/15]
WAVYVSDAEKYDKALVESWRSDMDGMLIFAGLFSASPTAFLIESYRNLSPDLESTTVLLLNQISHQLAAVANGTTVTSPTPALFTLVWKLLLCNGLWFVSLALSLMCALVATLLEQWAWEFLHRAEICLAPVVDLIPLLLHTSLIFFFGGLVAFLAPVNKIIMVLVAALLGFVTSIYLAFTILPLIYLSCPYRTPLSNMLWHVRQDL